MYSDDPSPVATHALSTVEVRNRLIIVALFLIAVVATPVHWWLAFLIELVVLSIVVFLSAVPIRRLCRRWLAVGPFLLMLAFGAPLARGFAGGWEMMLGVFAKSMLSLTAVILLVETTPIHRLMQGLLALRVPKLLVSIIALMIRYRELFADELARMNQAKRARTFRKRWLEEWRILPNFVGILFLRGLSRAERVHDAMLARGWNGELPLDVEPEVVTNRDGRGAGT